jgi:hypothetical protein
MNTAQLPPLPEIPDELLPVTAAPLPPSLLKEIQALPEIPEIQGHAAREKTILAAIHSMSTESARRDASAEAASLRANPTPANIEKLKTIQPLESRIAAYEEQCRQLLQDQKRLRREAYEPRAKLVAYVAARLVEIRAEASAEESAVFEKHGLPFPESRAAAHFTRTLQGLIGELKRELETGYGPNLEKFLQGFGVTPASL